jgi:hypothetical protein
VVPSSEADPARGGVWPSSEADLTRGVFRRAALVDRGGHQGRGRVVHVFWVRELIRDSRFFAGFKRVSPGYLGDPCGCPRQVQRRILWYRSASSTTSPGSTDGRRH